MKKLVLLFLAVVMLFSLCSCESSDYKMAMMLLKCGEYQSAEKMFLDLGEFEDAPEKVWQSNMFGKSLYDLVSDGMRSKLEHMPDESREKLGETLERIINEGAGGLLCILL